MHNWGLRYAPTPATQRSNSVRDSNVLLAEPSPTQGDIHFRLLDTPVRIHPFFWVTTVLLGLNVGEETPPAQLLNLGCGGADFDLGA